MTALLEAAATPKSPGTGAPARRRGRSTLLTVSLLAALLLLSLLSAGIGAYEIPLGDVLASVQHRIGLGWHALDRTAESVLWNIWLPRVVLAVLVGASLGCAGALMQDVFGNRS